MGYQAIEHLTFNSDRTIFVTDTVKIWEIDYEELDIIEESLKVSSEKTVYEIHKNGKIEKKKYYAANKD